MHHINLYQFTRLNVEAKTGQLIRCARWDEKGIRNVLFYKHCHFPHHKKLVQQQQPSQRIFKIITCVHGIQRLRGMRNIFICIMHSWNLFTESVE